MSRNKPFKEFAEAEHDIMNLKSIGAGAWKIGTVRLPDQEGWRIMFQFDDLPYHVLFGAPIERIEDAYTAATELALRLGGKPVLGGN